MNNVKSFEHELREYVSAFSVAMLLSAASYFIVTVLTDLSKPQVMLIVLALAITQLFIQLTCFLHVRFENSPYSRSNVLLLTVGMMLVVVVGSIWIMKNLDYRMGTSAEAMQEYMLKQNKKGF